jgi:H+/Cl- antiporter ClcA
MCQNEVKVLLNENKVKMMTKMAIYEKNEGRDMIKNARYFKSDYIALGMLKTLIATTIAYIIMTIMYAMFNLENIVADINSLDYVSIGKKLAIYYVIVLVIFGIIAGFVYGYKYEHSRKGLKKYFARLNKLERFYNGQKKRK